MLEEGALLKRIRILVAFRVFLVTALLGSFLAFRIGLDVFPYPSNVFYIIVFLYAMSIVCLLLIGRVPALPLAYMQIVADSLSAVTLVLLTGGIESWFSWILILIVLAAAMVINKRAAYVTATLISFLYAALLVLQFYGIIPVHYYEGLMEKDFLYRIFSHVVGLYLTALLTGRLIMRLERKDIDFEELANFNRAVIESTPSGLFTTDPNGKVEIFNRSAELITGLPREEVSGRHIGEVFAFLKEFREEVRGEKALVIGGREKTLGYTVSRLYDLSGNKAGFIGIFQDLTELKALAREIKHKEQLAAVGELSASIAHEIRNPLGSLKGSVEMLREGSVSGEQKDRLMAIALSEMDRLNKTITDFLSFARPGEPEPEVFDLHEALTETLELLRNRDNCSAEIIADFRGTMEVNADRRRIKDVFWNLGVNALEAMAGGGILNVDTFERDGMVHVLFSDTGPGIPEANLERIFFPFYTTKRTGTGLGLSISFRAVEELGGTIRVDSVEGGGSVFTVTLPRGNEL